MIEASRDTVYLLVGDDDDADGELIPRADLPVDAYKTGQMIDGLGGSPTMYEVWIVEDTDADDH